MEGYIIPTANNMFTQGSKMEHSKKRCQNAMVMSQNIGWGFGIEMENIYYDSFQDEDDE